MNENQLTLTWFLPLLLLNLKPLPSQATVTKEYGCRHKNLSLTSTIAKTYSIPLKMKFQAQLLKILPILVLPSNACLTVVSQWLIEGWQGIVVDNSWLRCSNQWVPTDVVPDETTGMNLTLTGCEDGYSATIFIKTGPNAQSKLIEYKTPYKTFGPYDMGATEDPYMDRTLQYKWMRTWC